MPQWEYTVKEYNSSPDSFEAFLNQHSQEGWQLVTTMPASWVGGTSESMPAVADNTLRGLLVVFQRPSVR